MTARSLSVNGRLALSGRPPHRRRGGRYRAFTCLPLAAIVECMWPRWVFAGASTLAASTTWGAPAAGQEANANAPTTVSLPHKPALGPEVHAGVAALVSSSSAHDENHVWDTAYAFGLWYRPRPEFAFGASYEHVGLGSANSHDGANYVDANYEARVLWGQARLYPYQYSQHSLLLGVRAGVVFMHQTANGTRASSFDEPVGEPFQCSGNSNPNIALGAEAGYELRATKHLNLLAAANASMLRGTSAVVDGCTTGLGSPTSVSAGVGFSYLFDM